MSGLTNEFDGCVAIVTGGGQGIGAATVELLAERGAIVAVLDCDASGESPATLGIACDVTDNYVVVESVRRVATEFGGIDVLINNAGISAVGDVTQNDESEWFKVLDVNLVGAARVCRAAMPFLLESTSASIVNVCSSVAFVGVRDRVLYGASKAAVLGLTLAMAADHVGDGIRVNAVAPGTTDTAWVDRLLEGSDDEEAAKSLLENRQPLGRLVSAMEVAHAIVSIASPSAGAITGAVLRVDGGMASLRV